MTANKKLITMLALTLAATPLMVPTKTHAIPHVVIGGLMMAGAGSYYVVGKLGDAIKKQVEGFTKVCAENLERFAKFSVAAGGIYGAWHVSKWWHGGSSKASQPSVTSGPGMLTTAAQSLSDTYQSYKWPVAGALAAAAVVAGLKRYADAASAKPQFSVVKVVTRNPLSKQQPPQSKQQARKAHK